MRLAAELLLVLTSLAFSTEALQSNPEEEPLNLHEIVPNLCLGRSSDCKVELDVPAACIASGENTSTCPIVFHFHGSGGNILWFKKTAKVHENNVIGVYPQGDCVGWNTGPKDCNMCSWDDFECTEDPDEGAFIAGIIDEIRDMGAYGHIYLVGNSNGAALAQRLAVNAGTELPIKGIVSKVTQLLASPPRSGPGVLNYNQPEAGNPKVSLLTICGTNDGLIPYEGGSSAVFGGDENFQLMSVADSDGVWAAHNGCDATPTERTVSASGGSGATSAIFMEYPNCDGAIVESYKVIDAGHGAGGATLDGVDAIDVVYNFIFRVEALLGGSSGPSAPAPSPSQPVSPTPPAPSPSTCEDDLTWHGKVSVDHDCNYVGDNPEQRCAFVGNDGTIASIACPVTCNACPATAPTPSVTPAPVASPATCVDDPSWHGMHSPNHTCTHVAKDHERRCHWVGSDGRVARDACPATCGTCSSN
jgi:poly(3-hydroxybutyrate) depolymerase